MEKTKSRITFKQALKDASLVAATLLILKMIHKLFFNYGEMIDYFHRLFSADNLVLALFISVSTVMFIWISMSLIFAAVYYIYSRIREKNSNI
jgi:hypothetical protein